MKRKFVVTQNVKRFVDLMDTLKKRTGESAQDGTCIW